MVQVEAVSAESILILLHYNLLLFHPNELSTFLGTVCMRTPFRLQTLCLFSKAENLPTNTGTDAWTLDYEWEGEYLACKLT